MHYNLTAVSTADLVTGIERSKTPTWLLKMSRLLWATPQQNAQKINFADDFNFL